MLGEQQPIIPNLSSAPPPNANPNPPHTNASHLTYSHGLNGFESVPDSATYQLAGGTTSEATQVPTVIHLRQLVNIQSFQCDVCNIACDTRDVLEKHKVGKKHVKNMKKLAGSSSIAQEMAPQEPPVVGSETSVGELENKKHKLLQNGASVDALIYCHICNVVCNNQDVYQSHVAGKRHSAKAAIQLAFSNGTSNTKAECSSQALPSNDGSQKKPETLQLLWCELCKISCTSNELLNLHLAGKKHLKNLKRSEQTPDLSLTMENLEKLEKPIEPNPTVTTEPNGKRAGSHEDVQTKKQKVVQEGGVSDAPSTTCIMCNVVCNSPTDFRAHLAGKKHIVTAVRQAEAQTTGQAK